MPHETMQLGLRGSLRNVHRVHIEKLSVLDVTYSQNSISSHFVKNHIISLIFSRYPP